MSPTLPPPPFTSRMTDDSGIVLSEWQRFLLAQQRIVTLDVAPRDAAYITATVDPTLTNEVSLGALSSGYVKITTAAGVASPSTTATIPAADLTGTLPALDGSNLTNLTSGNLVGALPAISGAALTALPNPLPAVSGAALTNLNASALASGTVDAARLPLVLTSGTYTPTLTNSVNVAASTAYVCNYLRVGSVVTVSGQVDVDPTAASDTQLGISLPIASNFATATQCAGTAVAFAVAGLSAVILADATNDTALMEWTAVDTANRAFYFSFTYLVI